jgi:hypothetical protein
VVEMGTVQIFQNSNRIDRCQNFSNRTGKQIFLNSIIAY